jgi:flagellar biosynthesis protein FlhG
MADSLRNGCWEGAEVRLPMDQSSGIQAFRRSGVQEMLSRSPERRPGTREAGGARLNARSPLVAIASGKGGVGKTFLAINLALALRDRGHRCLLVDLDWGLANVDVALGLAPILHVGHVLAGECAIEDALIDYDGLTILPNGCGEGQLAHLSRTQRAELLETVRSVHLSFDIVIADTHPGIGALSVDILREAGASLIVSTPEPTALTDTYALFKILGETETQGPAGLIINQASCTRQGDEAASHLDAVARRFLGHGIACWGHVLEDSAVQRSVRQQQALLTSAPRSLAAGAIRMIAASLLPFLEDDSRASQSLSRTW